MRFDFGEKFFISRWIFFRKVAQELPPVSHLFEEAPAGRKIFFVRLEVFGQLFNLFGQKSDLHFRGARVSRVDFKLLNNFLFSCFVEHSFAAIFREKRLPDGSRTSP
jgi:hypothetical protein